MTSIALPASDATAASDAFGVPANEALADPNFDSARGSEPAREQHAHERQQTHERQGTLEAQQQAARAAGGDQLAFLDDVVHVLERAHVPWAQLSDDEVVAAVAKVDRVARLVQRERIAAAGAVAARSSRERGRDGIAAQRGYSSGQSLIEAVTGVDMTESRKLVRLAEATGAGRADATLSTGGGALEPGAPGASGGDTLGGDGVLGGDGAFEGGAALGGGAPTVAPDAPFPLVALALAQGRIASDFALAITDPLARVRSGAEPERLREAEQHLLDYARTHTIADVRRRASDWAASLAPQLHEQRTRRLREQRSFTFHAQRDGMLPFSGLADPQSAALIKGAFDFRNGPTGPKFVDADGGGQDEIGGDVALHDPRTRQQKNLDMLVGLITAGVRAQGAGKPRTLTTTTVIATVRADDAERREGIGWLDGIDEPVAMSAIETLRCDGDGVTVDVDFKGEPLRFARDERLFKSSQRLAAFVRDGGCPIPGCDSPAHWSQLHHVVEWQHGGLTDLDNAMGPCSFHHTSIHEEQWQLRMVGGVPHLLVADDPELSGRPRPISKYWSGPAGVPAADAKPYWMRLGRSRVLSAPDSAKVSPTTPPRSAPEHGRDGPAAPGGSPPSGDPPG